MRAGLPQRPDEIQHRKQAGRAGQVDLATLCQAGGAVLAVATLTCSLLNVISANQAIALGLPATVLVIGGLIASSVPDPSVSSRLGFQAGLRAGALVNLYRSFVRYRG
jgi:hypothetical protein